MYKSIQQDIYGQNLTYPKTNNVVFCVMQTNRLTSSLSTRHHCYTFRTLTQQQPTVPRSRLPFYNTLRDHNLMSWTLATSYFTFVKYTALVVITKIHVLLFAKHFYSCLNLTTHFKVAFVSCIHNETALPLRKTKYPETTSNKHANCPLHFSNQSINLCL